MKCSKCNSDWPDTVKFCGKCGTRLQKPGSKRSVVEEEVVNKIRGLLPKVGLGKFMEPSPGVFVTQKGSTHVQVRVVPMAMNQAAIRSTSPVTIGTSITQDLLEFLLKENASLLFGAFGVGPKNEIVYSHTIMASSVDVLELGSSVSTVVNMADKYDDQIVQRWGGKTARQMAVDSFVAPVLLKALLKRKASPRPRVTARPTRTIGRPGLRVQPRVSEAIRVSSVAEEYAYLARQRCTCGSEYQRDSQVLLEIDGLHYDQLNISCSQCGASKSLLFDINSFFGKL